ncbi:oligosaccharide flippase family protein [Vibrio porteresiae]|uniref:Oligosaccharide flippase family protein n=1 Tax=Vibrio porteresiae DSM 19223 TaxID=1123496 RepID=A0ABZ0QAT8_9VIBR|nr:oligosaccharide flippase family protein [Vibrio porteresiae]WPC72892.1 oligosaccharide flippase family protein [Vibrio porteresiae DSM 19223]
MIENLNKKIAIGYLWNLASKWITRFIGIISTLILVRVLNPIDFGIATLANIVMALFVMLAEVGTDKYVIKSQSCTNELLNSAWSLNIALKLGCGLFIALLSFYVADFIHEPLLTNVLLVCSVIPVIGALKNVGLLNYERELNYRPLTQLSVLVKLTVFPITIGLALWLKSYWALVIGTLMSEVITVLGSYWIHPYRPKWSSRQWSEQWHFSKWMVVSTTTGYLRSRLDAFLLGRFLPSNAVGLYRVSQEFAWLPFSELIAPATRSFYAGLTQLIDDKEALTHQLCRYLALAYLLVVPSAAGIYVLQDEIVSVVMGEKWADAAPVLGLLSLLMLSMPLNIALQSLLTHMSKLSYLVWIDVVMIVAIGASFSLLYQQGITLLATYTLARVALVVVFIALLLLVYKAVLHVALTRVLAVLLLPMLPSGVMYAVVALLKSALAFNPLLNLLILAVVGMAMFIPLMVLLIWGAKAWIPEYQYVLELLANVRNTVLKNRVTSQS